MPNWCKPGAAIRVSGLVSRKELNGERGVILPMPPNKNGRLPVRVSGEDMWLKPECCAAEEYLTGISNRSTPRARAGRTHEDRTGVVRSGLGVAARGGRARPARARQAQCKTGFHTERARGPLVHGSGVQTTQLASSSRWRRLPHARSTRLES